MVQNLFNIQRLKLQFFILWILVSWYFLIELKIWYSSKLKNINCKYFLILIKIDVDDFVYSLKLTLKFLYKKVIDFLASV